MKRFQIENRIADYLPRPMISNIASSIGSNQRNLMRIEQHIFGMTVFTQRID